MTHIKAVKAVAILAAVLFVAWTPDQAVAGRLLQRNSGDDTTLERGEGLERGSSGASIIGSGNSTDLSTDLSSGSNSTDIVRIVSGGASDAIRSPAPIMSIANLTGDGASDDSNRTVEDTTNSRDLSDGLNVLGLLAGSNSSNSSMDDGSNRGSSVDDTIMDTKNRTAVSNSIDDRVVRVLGNSTGDNSSDISTTSGKHHSRDGIEDDNGTGGHHHSKNGTTTGSGRNVTTPDSPKNRTISDDRGTDTIRGMDDINRSPNPLAPRNVTPDASTLTDASPSPSPGINEGPTIFDSISTRGGSSSSISNGTTASITNPSTATPKSNGELARCSGMAVVATVTTAVLTTLAMVV